MNWVRWFPWKAVARHVARRHGFLDPVTFLDRLRQFARPSEVGEPVELLRAGAAFHARGLINRAIQFNLDWVWPYWVERQFNPADESFVPRAFSFSHINLTHRNWTAVGLPDIDVYSIVDPRGLITPVIDGWSLDFWIVGANCEPLLLPSKASDCHQRLELNENLRVVTQLSAGDVQLTSAVSMEITEGFACCVARIEARAPAGAKLIVTARPYNPEGISFIDSIRLFPNETQAAFWLVNDVHHVTFSRKPERSMMSCYSVGDVMAALATGESRDRILCPVGMATAATVFPALEPIEVRVPLETIARIEERTASMPRVRSAAAGGVSRRTWHDELDRCALAEIPDERWRSLYSIAVRTLILHTPHEVYPGPYTYKRFWYRDAAFILNALLAIGAHERVRRALELFPRGQTRDGYFRSQEGEWDANGEVLWILDRYFSASGEPVPGEWIEMIERGARWILHKRMSHGSPHPGLFPAGFSAEHLGPNDFYYWDDFWGVAGLRAAARLLAPLRPDAARSFASAAQEFLQTIEVSIARSSAHKLTGAIPAAPDRRMDSGAIGSLVADCPLELFAPGDERILKTAEWLMAHSFYRGGFFQNMIHSGINAYLTLHVAQVLHRAGDARARHLVDAVADLASPTGQWPEAIHPRTLGGCMGDGQHVWAAAEWVNTMHAMFLVKRET